VNTPIVDPTAWLTSEVHRLEREVDALRGYRDDTEGALGRAQAEVEAMERREAQLRSDLPIIAWIIQELYSGGAWGGMELRHPEINDVMDRLPEPKWGRTGHPYK
jgi:predicted metal-dependent hydrolase